MPLPCRPPIRVHVTARRTSEQTGFDRRLAPRPLAAHLASAMMLWSSSRAVLPVLKDVSLLSSAAGERLRGLAAEIDALGSNSVAEALDLEITRRAKSYLAGLEAYRRHPYRRRDGAPRLLWQEGTTRLLDYGGGTAGPVILVVPSLINRFYVLDLLPKLSFLRHLAGRGLRPLVVDWDAPGREERNFDLTDYIAGRLESAFDAALRLAGMPIGVAGYCMGGLFALALALRRPDGTACLTLLATPWDFHAERAQPARFFSLIGDCLPLLCDERGTVPVEVIQSLFFMLDPFTAERKFTRFATLDPDSDEARDFVALEDWVNDGVPLAAAVARDCARSWYGDNEPARGLWKISGETVDPKLLRRPALVVLPSRDRIVPPSSAAPLAAVLGGATVLRPPLGHVGMMSTARAPAMLWNAIADWLRARLGAR
ncbi:MAG TPA: alpha/beta fold hydrolase [Stellaceae bacterium]|nr:alpha/beta fold hydrolase [Stellaceae bacterium]